MTSQNSSIAVDTNVLIYLHDSADARKRTIAEKILAGQPVVSSQVISEYVNVTRRILPLPKTEVLVQCAALLTYCQIMSVSHNTLSSAAQLVEAHDFQIFMP